MPIEAVFFDLDYTLYDMEQYLRGAFRDVARHVASDCAEDPALLLDSLWRHWQELGSEYGRLFDDWLEAHRLYTQPRLQECLDVYRAHDPVLRLYPGAELLLNGLRRRHRLGLITDGNLRMQQSKVKALGLGRIFDVVIYSASLSSSKPDPSVFRHALRLVGVLPERSVHVGDHPTRDVAGARRVGMQALRVLTGEFRHLPDDATLPPPKRVAEVGQLAAVLDAAQIDCGLRA